MNRRRNHPQPKIRMYKTIFLIFDNTIKLKWIEYFIVFLSQLLLKIQKHSGPLFLNNENIIRIIPIALFMRVTNISFLSWLSRCLIFLSSAFIAFYAWNEYCGQLEINGTVIRVLIRFVLCS